MSSHKLLYFFIFLIILMLTNPDREQHEIAYQEDVDLLSDQIRADKDINPLIKLGSLLANDLASVVLKSSTYHNYYVFSMLSVEESKKKRRQEDVISIGILGMVFVVLDHDKTKEELKNF